MLKQKHDQLNDLMDRKSLKGILIERRDNFSWVTGGANYVNIATDLGSSKLLITKERIYLISDNIEAPRLKDEEIKGSNIEVKKKKWYRFGGGMELVESLIGGGQLGSDVKSSNAIDVREELRDLRVVLTDGELTNYRKIGYDCGAALEKVCKEVDQGDTELEVAGKISAALYSRNLVPTVILVAADDRRLKYRHPLPTKNKVDNAVMLVAAGRRHGLNASATRMVHFGEPSKELKEKHEAVAHVDANMIKTTVPGKNDSEVIEKGVEAYENLGFGNEWELHHQGGIAGYNPRESKATPKTKEKIYVNQAYGWNPSITGTKSEDIITVNEDGHDIITQTGDFPYIEVDVNGQVIKRPDILVR